MNQMVRLPAIGQRDGDWVWDGSRWVCDADDGPPVCPPPAVCPPPFGPPVFSGPAGQPPWYPGANGAVSFGQTAPANPVRGHFWFDGITLWLFDGATWVGVAMSNTGGGNGTTPPVTVPSGPNPPFAPTVGGLWFNGTTLFIWDGHQWVPATQTKTFLQALQPPAPGPGDLWWDGAQLRLYDGTVWNIIGPTVAVGGQSKLVFAMQQPTGLAVASGWSLIPYSAPPLTAINVNWDSVTHRLTPQVPGLYYLSVRINAGTGCGVAIVKNDTNDFTGARSSDIIPAIASQGTTGWLDANGMADMNGTTDFLRCWTNHGGTIPNAGSNPTFVAALMA